MLFLCEVKEEATYIRHHKKKIALVFAAMRHFAQELQTAGYRVRYTRLDDEQNAGSFVEELKRIVTLLGPEKVVVTAPSEYRVLQALKTCALKAPIEIRPDDRFLCSIDDFRQWAQQRKQLRMEFFYRDMRRKHQILMDGHQPIGGRWNYDNENRKTPVADSQFPPVHSVKNDTITQEVLALVANEFGAHFGELEPFHFAVTRQQALSALDAFIEERLPHFGDYQDAMLQAQPWMYHAHISFYLNLGLLLPRECIVAAEHAYANGQAPLNAVEGFIRQILGWREYVRGIYWLKMPHYAEENHLQAQRRLPWFFWNGATQMNCLRQCVLQTQETAYAHHIQRLMVLGNFCLLAGIRPDDVNHWFMVVYADAFEWVELPNVTGMILFADGGYLASKPYAASGTYIHKMSDYCQHCRYKVRKKNGVDACPFNYLYWNFLLRSKPLLQGNPRLAMPYRTLAKMSDDKIAAIEYDAQRFLGALDNGDMV